MKRLSEIVVDGAIVPDLGAKERDEAIESLVDTLVSAGAAPPGVRDELVQRRLPS